MDCSVTWYKAPSKINVTVINNGVYDEIVNVTVYANNTIIKQIYNVAIASGGSTVLTVLWDGTIEDIPFNYGSYVISGYVDPVANETETGDNTFVDGTLIVTVRGDANGDGTVNVLDLILIASMLGRTLPPLDPPIYPLPWRIDTNNDYEVNVLDLIIVAVHLGDILPHSQH